MPTLISAIAGNSDAFETSHSINIDVGTAQAGRRLVGFLGRFSDATERITAASQITLGGSSTGVTLAGTSTTPAGQAGTFYGRFFEIDVPAALAGSQALVVSASDTTARRIYIVAACYSDGGVPTFAYGSNLFNNNPVATIASAAGQEVGLFVVAISAGISLTPGTGSSAITGASGGTGLSLFGIRENGAASVTIDGTFAGSEEHCCVAWSLPTAGPSAEVDQEGARFGNDDGNEAGHTFAAAQDSNHTAPVGTAALIRALLNGTGDPASSAFALRYQKNGAGGYVQIPVGATVPEVYGTVTFGAIGTGANGSTTVAPSYPAGITAGQYLTCHVSSGATNSETPTTPSGWTLVGTGASTDGTYGVDTGPRRMTVFGKIAAGTESGTLTVSITNGGTCRGTIARWTKSGAGAWQVTAQGGNDSTSGTGFSATLASMNWNTGDATIVAVGQRVDTATQSAQALTASGVTFGTRTNQASTAVTTGNDHRHVVDTFAAVTGTSNVNAAPTWAYTGSAACSGGVVVVRLREYTAAVTNEIYVEASANIAAGGEATTARLDAPAGKTTSDFIAGRRWDDENGTDSIDITADDYTEVEWRLNTQAPAVNGDYFDLRVYAGAVALATYSVTPRLTLGVPAFIPAQGLPRARVPYNAHKPLAVYRQRGVPPAMLLPASTGRSATFSLGAAVQLAQSVAASLGAAIQAPQSQAGTISLAVQQALAAQANIGAAVQLALAAAAAVEAAVQTGRAAAASVDVGVQAARTTTVAADLAVQRSLSAAASIDTYVQAATELACAVDLLVQQGNSLSAAVGLAVQASRAAGVDVDIAVMLARTAAASIGTAVQQAQSAAAQVEVAVLAARSAGVSVDLFVQAGFALGAALDTAVRFSVSAGAAADTAVQIARAATLEVSAAVSVEQALAAALQTAVQASVTTLAQVSCYIFDPTAFAYTADSRGRVGGAQATAVLGRLGDPRPSMVAGRIGGLRVLPWLRRIGRTKL